MWSLERVELVKIMNVAFSEILNSQLNSLAKTSEITKNLLTVCIDNAISEKEEDDNIENVSDVKK